MEKLCDKGGNTCQKIWIKSQKETNLGMHGSSFIWHLKDTILEHTGKYVIH